MPKELAQQSTNPKQNYHGRNPLRISPLPSTGPESSSQSVRPGQQPLLFGEPSNRGPVEPTPSIRFTIPSRIQPIASSRIQPIASSRIQPMFSNQPDRSSPPPPYRRLGSPMDISSDSPSSYEPASSSQLIRTNRYPAPRPSSMPRGRRNPGQQSFRENSQ